MQNSPKVTQEWSLHAEVTFSHGTQTPNPPQARNNVSMDYSWQKPTMGTAPNCASSTLRPCYGFQRGNILFTTTPPRGTPAMSTKRESGDAQQPRVTQLPYDRRCKSTCSIVLANPGELPQSFHYHCGDRACYHARPPNSSAFSPIPENCELCSNNQTPNCHTGKSNTFTTHFCTRVPERTVKKERQDAASQTEAVHTTRCENLQIPDSFQQKKPSKRLSRSPARLGGKSPLLQRRHSEASQSTGSRSSTPDFDNNPLTSHGKPRTVHIDVYCTGSEDADASASSETETTDESSPQTVFESEQIRVLHSKMGKCSLPRNLEHIPKRCDSLKEKSKPSHYMESRGYESDDILSSQYPSRMSSYTSITESTSAEPCAKACTARDPSWSTISSVNLSCEEKESLASTSWKDISTEFDSPAVSSSSVVTKFDQYLTGSDSFEYADAMDRLRIQEKAMVWANEGSARQSPDNEKKLVYQQQKFKEFLHRHLGKGTFPLWKSQHSDESDEEDDDDTGDAWSFIGRECSGPSLLRRESTVKKASKSPLSSTGTDIKSLTLPSRINHIVCDTGSLSDSGPSSFNKFARHIAIGPFGSKPPTPPPPKLESNIVSPFTSVHGTGTDQLSKAKKFGSIVLTLKKPGNHTGPSKNPDCSCAHCRSFYESTLYRGRARSVGAVNSDAQGGKNIKYLNIKNSDGVIDVGNVEPKTISDSASDVHKNDRDTADILC